MVFYFYDTILTTNVALYLYAVDYKMIFSVANWITLGNLISGCLAIFAVNEGHLDRLMIFFTASLIFDFLDGFVARTLNQTSDIGKQLDSLADMVSFGALPGFILFHLIQDSNPPIPWLGVIGFVITAAAALRLARFNMDTRQSIDFLGLNTPACSIAVIGLYYLTHTPTCYEIGFHHLLTSGLGLILQVAILSVLLLIELPMLSLKPDFETRSRLIQQLILVFGFLIIFVGFKFCGLYHMIVWYIIYSLILYMIKK